MMWVDYTPTKGAEMPECQKCEQPIDHLEEAHSPSVRQCREDGWKGGEWWHPECCPYCADDA